MTSSQTTQTVTPEEAERQMRLLAALTSGDRTAIEWAAEQIAKRAYERAIAALASPQSLKVTEPTMDNETLRAELRAILDAIEAAPWSKEEGERVKRIYFVPAAIARTRAALQSSMSSYGSAAAQNALQRNPAEDLPRQEQA